MNRRTVICLLAAATLAACGRPPSPSSPRPAPNTEVTTTSTTDVTTTTGAAPPPVTTTTTAQPKLPPPPPRTTTMTKPPPPPPKPPDRWVLPSGLRTSIEQQDGQFFPEVWARFEKDLVKSCPHGAPCVGPTKVIAPPGDDTRDCYIVDGGISVPDPLYEGGTITFRITNDLCSGR
ncbi:hypothetical protein ACIRG5_02505 [Lentzea sp. NPDC102401]|uniref:hypothetical protein n=1 Tax=Lentzea sp. NPDC102401 TaxID=3364128 RepID=UPI00382F1CD8